MVRPPTFDSNGMKKGAWSKEEDGILRDFVVEFGHRNWRRLPSLAGLARCGKSCRLRWLNYLKPGLKRGKITKQEDELIIKLHDQLGSKWSAIAANLAGRTDNEIKNYWHAHLKKRGRRGGDGINADAGVKESSSSSSSSSSEIRSCVTTDDHHVDANSAQDLYSFAQDELPYNPTQFDDVDFGIMFEEMQYDHTSTFSDSGTSFCNSPSADFWSQSFGEDILDMVLW